MKSEDIRQHSAICVIRCYDWEENYLQKQDENTFFFPLYKYYAFLSQFKGTLSESYKEVECSFSPEPAAIKYKKGKLFFTGYIFVIYYSPKDETPEITLYIFVICLLFTH